MKLHELFEANAKFTFVDKGEFTFSDWVESENINVSRLNDIDCSEKGLSSLEGAPNVVPGEFDCSYNNLKSLKGCPEHIGEHLYADHNKIESIEHLPKTTKKYISVENNNIDNLHNIHKIVKKMNGIIYFRDNPITSHVLGVLLIDGCLGIKLDNPGVNTIMNKHLSGDRDVFACQEELIENGFEDFAQL